MKAIQITAYGGIESLVITDVPKSTPQKNQVLVEIHAATINPFDIALRSGKHKEYVPLTLPVTMGGDFAGRIIALGESVTDFAIGDDVFGTAIVLSGGSGAFAQFAVANTASIAKKPASLSFTDAASLPLVGSSTTQALEEHIKLQKAQKILIHGGAGGIGSIAIQVAKFLGAYVATTVSADAKTYVQSLGADLVIDYKTEQFTTIVKDFDAVFDTVGGTMATASFPVLHPGGILVSMLGKPDEAIAKQYSVTAIGQSTKNTTEHLVRVAELVERGAIKPQVDTVFSIDQYVEAFTLMEQGRPRSKVVIKF